VIDGDRVRYRGPKEKYRDVTGTVRRAGIIRAFWVDFDNGLGGLFSHASDFFILSAVERLGELAEEEED